MKDNKGLLALLLLAGGVGFWYLNKDKKKSVVVSSESDTDTDTDTDVLGCTDAEALNYNPSANSDDGSCEFEQVVVDPIDPVDPVEVVDAIQLDYSRVGGTCNDLSLTINGLQELDIQYGLNNLLGRFYFKRTDGVADYTSAFPIDLAGEESFVEIYEEGTNASNFTTDGDSYIEIFNISTNEVVATGEQYIDVSDCYYSDELQEIEDGSDEEIDPVVVIEEPIEVYGCTDAESDNYNPNATQDDGSCTYICDDMDLDGVCDEDEIGGCTDPTATNYNPNATEDLGGCVYFKLGCTNPDAENYDPEATEDNGSCIISVSTREQNIINYIIDVYIQSGENDGLTLEQSYWEALVYLSPFYDFTSIAENFGISGCNGTNNGGDSFNQCNFITNLTESSEYENLISQGYSFEDIFIPTIPVNQWNDSGCYLPENEAQNNDFTQFCVIRQSVISLVNGNGMFGNYQYTWETWVNEYDNWMETGDFNPYVSFGL